MKIAAAAYPLDELSTWADYEAKITRWVGEAAGLGAELLVFPEYGAMELASLAGPDVSSDLERAIHAVSDMLPQVDALHQRLAAAYGVHILAGSAPAATQTRPVNRARLFSPTGQIGVQDKQIMTRSEEDVWDVVPGGPLQVFDTALGRIGVLICYDSEFPLLGRALVDCDVICVPSVTGTLSGYWRVRIGAMARALENQCVTVMSSIVGEARWFERLESSFGAGGIFGPPDRDLPATGVFAAGELNTPGWTIAEVDMTQIAEVRRDGIVLNRKRWVRQEGRDAKAAEVSLR